LERIFYCDVGGCHASYDSVVFNRCCNYFMGVTMEDLNEVHDASEKILSFCEDQGMTIRTTVFACLIVAASLGGDRKKEAMRLFGMALDESEYHIRGNK
jgi:hypothetical protein